jgi:hypothetical protein
LTHEALDAHRNRSACLWNNPDTFLRIEQSKNIVADAVSLGIDLPAEMVERMAVRFDGMTPLDRLLSAPGTSLEELNCRAIILHTTERNDRIHLLAISVFCETCLIDAQAESSLAIIGPDVNYCR